MVRKAGKSQNTKHDSMREVNITGNIIQQVQSS